MDQRAATTGPRPRRGARTRARRAWVSPSVCLLLTVFLLGVLPLATGCLGADIITSTSVPSGPPVIRIGALFPLTGDLASEGQSALRGIREAIEEVNDGGGVRSFGGALFTLVEADSQGDSVTASSEVERLVHTEGVAAVVGTGQSTVALEATAAAEQLNVPFLVSAGAADEITERQLSYTFRLCPMADWYARDQVAFLGALRHLAGLQVTAVALLHEEGAFGRQTAESQRNYLAQAGIEVAADIEYSAVQADVNEEILEIKRSGAQAILTATFLGDAALIAKGLAVSHVGIPVIDAAGGVLSADFSSEAGEAGEGMMSVAEFAQGLPASQSLERSLTSSGETLDADALYGYQAVWLLATALERAGSTEGPRLRDALASTVLTGSRLVLPQHVLAFDATGQNHGARLLVVQVQGGRLVTVWPTEYAEAEVRLP